MKKLSGPGPLDFSQKPTWNLGTLSTSRRPGEVFNSVPKCQPPIAARVGLHNLGCIWLRGICRCIARPPIAPKVTWDIDKARHKHELILMSRSSEYNLAPLATFHMASTGGSRVVQCTAA